MPWKSVFENMRTVFSSLVIVQEAEVLEDQLQWWDLKQSLKLRNERRYSILMSSHYADLGSASDWSCRSWNCFNQSEALPWVVHVISMEFRRSFLRRHFAGKPILASRNVGCFLKLAITQLPKKKRSANRNCTGWFQTLQPNPVDLYTQFFYQ